MSTKENKPAGTKKPFFKRKKIIVLMAILLLLVTIRLFFPAIVLHYANKALGEMNGYTGHVNDIDISLYRGAYEINDIYIHKKDSASGKESDFFKAKNIDLSVEWKALFKGSLVGELEFNTADIIFTKDRVEIGDVKKDTNDFRKVLEHFMPLKVNRFEVKNGSVHYVDRQSKPKVDVALQQMHVLALNLTNAADSATLLPASVTAQAKAYEGTMNLNMKLNPLAKAATFDLNAEIKNVNLVLLNDFLKAYGNFDVHKGNFGLYSELAAKEGKFKGYVKPLIKGLDVVGAEDKKDGVFHKIWESAVGGVGILFRNQKKDQIATRVNLEGNFNDPKTNTLDAIWEVLRNAFIQALMPSVDNQINISSVDSEAKPEHRNIIQKIFGKKKKDGDKESKKEEKKEKEKEKGKEKKDKD